MQSVLKSQIDQNQLQQDHIAITMIAFTHMWVLLIVAVQVQKIDQK